jgi:hypothetical protein
MMTAEARNKLSDFMNQYKGLANNPACGCCGMKLLFGGAIVVQIHGQRENSLLPNYFSGDIRTVTYPFFGEPTHIDLPPPYTVTATDSEAFDKLKDVELLGKAFETINHYNNKTLTRNYTSI